MSLWAGRTYTARTDARDFDFDFTCAHCGVRAPMRVRTESLSLRREVGYGAGDDQGLTSFIVENAAVREANVASQAAACPQCRTQQPAVIARVEEILLDRDKRKRRAVVIAAIAGAVTAIVAGVPAAQDARTSLSLPAMCLALTISIAAFVFAVLRWPRATPPLSPSERTVVTFGAPQPDGSLVWTPAPPASMPVAIPPAQPQPALAIVLTFCGLIAVFGTVKWWQRTFASVYVVDAARTGMLVRIDGADAGYVGRGSKEAAFRAFELRLGQRHHVELVRSDGETLQFDLDPAHERWGGWLIAPRAADHDLCLFAHAAHYVAWGRPPPDEWTRFDPQFDVWPVKDVIEYAFVEPPSQVGFQGTERKKTLYALRARSCREVEPQR
jgi:hypothetical protein